MSITLNGTTGITTPDITSTTSTLGALTQALDLGSTGQVVFPATQNASANANTLDDYEEGTWTPDVWHNSSNNSTWLQRVGTYKKIGSVVHCWLKVDGGNSGTAGSQLFITGVPFTPDATNPSVGTFGIWAANGLTPQSANIFWVSSNVFWVYNGGGGLTSQCSYFSGYFAYNA